MPTLILIVLLTQTAAVLVYQEFESLRDTTIGGLNFVLYKLYMFELAKTG